MRGGCSVALMALSKIRPFRRNIAERCPGDQTNNRAELVVRNTHILITQTSLLTSLVGHHACLRNNPDFEETFAYQDRFAILHELCVVFAFVL